MVKVRTIHACLQGARARARSGQVSELPRVRFRVDARPVESRRFHLTGSKSGSFIRGCRNRGRPWLQGGAHYSRKRCEKQEQKENKSGEKGGIGVDAASGLTGARSACSLSRHPGLDPGSMNGLRGLVASEFMDPDPSTWLRTGFRQDDVGMSWRRLPLVIPGLTRDP